MPSGLFLLGCRGLEIQDSEGGWNSVEVIGCQGSSIRVRFHFNGKPMVELLDHRSDRIKLPSLIVRTIVAAEKRPSVKRHIRDEVGITPLVKKRRKEKEETSLLTYEELLTSVVESLGNKSLANLANTCSTIYPIAMSAHKFHLVTHEPGAVGRSTPIADLGILLRPRSYFCKCKIGQRSWLAWQKMEWIELASLLFL
jgi:hypothetical protein